MRLSDPEQDFIETRIILMANQSPSSRFFPYLALWALFPAVGFAQTPTNLNYQQPPKPIVEMVDVLPTPAVSVSPGGKAGSTRWMLIQQVSGLPSIADLAQPELRLAGLRFNPKTNGPSRGRYITSLQLKALPAGKEIAVTDLPPQPKIRFADWSPDGRTVSFVNISDAKSDPGLSLWIIDVDTARARRLAGRHPTFITRCLPSCTQIKSRHLSCSFMARLTIIPARFQYRVNVFSAH
jgi:hypothetical protein